jgi:nucleoside-diphosphate-sugar epimerase
MEILVTGATGFLGRHLVSRLAGDGHTVRALARQGSQVDHLRQASVTLVYGDLKDRESLQRAVDGVEMVYHAGAAMRGSWQEYGESTVQGTEQMLDLSLAAGVKRFVHISSLAVYQVHDLPRNAVVDEHTPYDPTPQRIGAYAYSKIEAEKAALAFYAKGLPVTVVRPGVIYGPHGKVLFPHLGYFVKKAFVLIGRGDNLLPLTYIDNTVDALLLAAQHEQAIGQIYNVTDGVTITQKEYLEQFKQATQSTFPVIPVPMPLLLLPLALVEQLKALGVSKLPSASRYGLTSKYKSLYFDSTKAKQELGWRPQVSLADGLHRTFDWHNNQAAIYQRGNLSVNADTVR